MKKTMIISIAAIALASCNNANVEPVCENKDSVIVAPVSIDTNAVKADTTKHTKK